MDYDTAVSELYRSPLAEFVATRKRLAAELKAGDKAQAKRFEKLARPSISAWAVNQLWWRARPAFDAMLESAARLKAGDATASTAHRAALAELRRRAAEVLSGDAHAASEAVLRRVAHTLSALALNGGFEPDRPGALVQDRDPPGFEAFASVGGITPALRGGVMSMAPAASAAAREPSQSAAERTRAEQERTRLEQERERVEQERIRLEEQRARARAERQRLERELQRAEAAAALAEREVDRARQALAAAELELASARSAVADLWARLELAQE